MNVPALLFAVVALVVGGLLGYLIGAAQCREGYEARLRDAETGRASLEGSVAELRGQVDAQRSALQDVQSRLEAEKEQRAAAEAGLKASLENLADQRRAIEQTKTDMKAVFQALASEALSESTFQFLDLAKARFETIEQEASTELETRKVAIEGLIHPLAETLRNLQSHLSLVESTRQEAYGELRSQVRQLADVGRELRQETGTLSTALRQPRVRGSWGELTLRNAVELAGMSPYADFAEQPTVETETGRIRPDMTVRLPGGRQIVVDAKVPLEAFFAASEAAGEAERQEAMKKHAQLVRDHIQQLASKAYWSQFVTAPELVILFMPGESFFSAALERDRTLIEDSLAKRVLPASPTTLIALLRAIAYGWRQHQVEENAARISALGKELYDRILKFIEHIGDLRDGLDKAGQAYNRAVGSFSDRLLPSARRLREMGVSSDAELPAPEPGQVELRPPPAPPEDES
ncbi:MAG TPA: DNA recombination protein RmuC [Candidatus Acidoferrales bacterium]|nr:DNA recombination protein RmuC [Candidatus Acidoferrales bacterium]